MTPTQWQEDLLVLATQLTVRHRNAFHHVSRAAFEKAVATLDRRISSLRDYEVVVGLQRIAAMIGDGHTRVDASGLYHRLPLELFWFGHELRVIRTVGAYGRTLGTRMLSVGEHDLAAVLERLGALIPQAENAWFVLHNSALLLPCAEPLAALGILSEPSTAAVVFEQEDGTRFELELEPVLPGARLDWLEAWPVAPLHLRRAEMALWSTFLPDTRTAYASFRRYDNLADHARELWERVDNTPVDRLVIDMRHNGGGNYVHGREHLVHQAQRRQSVNRAGRLFVVTGRATFSAAMTNATDFRRETEAILVGEPPGARPNGFQELSRFTLPNSKLDASCSILHYRFQDGDGPCVMPDKRIDPDWRTFRAGRDPVMEWIEQRSLDPVA